MSVLDDAEAEDNDSHSESRSDSRPNSRSDSRTERPESVGSGEASRDAEETKKRRRSSAEEDTDRLRSPDSGEKRHKESSRRSSGSRGG